MRAETAGCIPYSVNEKDTRFAPIGLVDVFMAPRGISSIRRVGDEISVELREEGPSWRTRTLRPSGYASTVPSARASRRSP